MADKAALLPLWTGTMRNVEEWLRSEGLFLWSVHRYRQATEELDIQPPAFKEMAF
jgi:hypothetical protein